MRRSVYFMPTLRETPSDAQVASHRLMLRSGMVHQSAAGIYTWLPLGLRVLQKVEGIIREEQDRIGNQEVLMPTLQPAEIWQQSGRYNDYGKEMLRIKDRHERELVYGPTNEEMITSIFRQYVKSYRDLPKNLYQIQWKFRDEIRPRFGVMRGREFLMKDAYSFDLDLEGARRTYRQMYAAYLRTFRRMGVTAIPVSADSGAIGGDMSHEFQIVAPTGESRLYYDKEIDTLNAQGVTDYEVMSQYYAAADERHIPGQSRVDEDTLNCVTGIEIGHIFYFGTKYSEPLGTRVMGPQGDMITPEMGSYGIGVSRLVAAIIEAHHDEKGIKWPETVAPFKVGLINLKAQDTTTEAACQQAYETLLAQGIEVLYDDRDERPGPKFADMDLIGLPWQLIIGPQNWAQGLVELKCRQTEERHLVSLDSALSRLAE